MKDGFIKVAAVTPTVEVANVEHNVNEIIKYSWKASNEGAKIIVFPELCLTGYTCQDLFLSSVLIEGAKMGLKSIIDNTADIDALIFVGLPIEKDGKLYNVAAAFSKGILLGMIPKQYIPNYNEFYEVRHFTPGSEEACEYDFFGENIPLGQNILFNIDGFSGLKIAAEICEDLWVADTPSTRHAMNGATVIVNLSASNELVGKDAYRKMLVTATSARLVCGYVYTSAGYGESTQDLVFAGHDLIAENGAVLAESKPFESDEVVIIADIDIQKIISERRRANTFIVKDSYISRYVEIPVDLELEDTRLSRIFSPHPFVPNDEASRNARCAQILNIQAAGLKKRLKHTRCRTSVIGISGGLDSTLALLVMARAFDMAGLKRKDIIAVTMPCFGTTDRTYHNACELTRKLYATLREVNIEKSVARHFIDIDHDMLNHNVVFENGQARERTQVLMDIANQVNGLVIGTGDMSELALGWATYNGDHMSMYGVNSGVPKTLVRHLVKYYADTCEEEQLRVVLNDILATPVSPELLPPTKDGTISQQTENLVGPYELHDFFMYYMLRFGFSPRKIYRMAVMSFKGRYDEQTILKWEKTFVKRFFAQQFKRSCLPDGPKVGTTAVSPRGDLRMPSDAVAKLWLDELEMM